jgi:hypothetical protein
MGKKVSKQKTKSYPDTWTVKNEIQVNGRTVVAGTELSITGEAGRFRFVKHVTTPTAEWIDVVGGRKGYSVFRSFYVSRVKTVHWKNKTVENVVKERKEQKKLENANSSED